MTETKTYKSIGTRRALLAWVAIGAFVASAPAQRAQTTVPAGEMPRLTYQGSPLEFVLAEYSDRTGRTILQSPSVSSKVKITLQSQGKLTFEEYLQAIETVLSMNGIALLKVGDKFLKVVPIAKARQEAMDILVDTSATLEETDELISQMIHLNHIEPAEAMKAINPLKHSYGVIHVFDRINSILVTDSGGNINRMLQVIKAIDQPMEAREEPIIVQIHHAKASDIKRKLTEIIAESQKQEKKRKSTIPVASSSGPPGVVRRPSGPPGVIRARRRLSAPKSTTTATLINNALDDVDRGVIRGSVQIVADDRTNILIIITRRENMRFFEKIIKVLDVETAPDVIIKVFRLEFAEAKTIASMLNNLIGTKSGKDDVQIALGSPESGTGESAVLRDFIARRKKEKAAAALAAKTAVGELSSKKVKILSDERTNALIIMASKADIAAITDIIKDMDVMLSQVLIEAVIIEVQLGDEFISGVDWIQRSMMAYRRDSAGRNSPVMAFTGAGGGGMLTPADATGVPSYPTSGGLSYYFTLFGMNLDMVISLVSKDDRTRVVSSPVILTTDNTEATITSTEQIYVFRGKKRDQYGGEYDDYTTKDVGLTLTVKPHINANKVVMMEIKQTMSEPGSVGEPQSGARVSSSRTLNASVAVKNRQTIVLGGQVRSQKIRSRTKIPFLGSIPFLGRLFSHVSEVDVKREMVVFITPYVVDTEEEVAIETRRRRRSLDIDGLWKRGWSDSELAEPVSEKTKPAAKDGKKPRAREQSVEPLRSRPTMDEPAQPVAKLPEPVEEPTEPVQVPVQVPEEPQETPEDVGQEPRTSTEVDPELLEFMKKQEKRWRRTIQKVDRAVAKELDEGE